MFFLILGLIGPFFLKRPDGKPWMRPQDFLPDTQSWFNSLDQTGQRMIASVKFWEKQKVEKTIVYRSRTADGGWQFSDKPLNDQSERIELKGNVNLMAPVKPFPDQVVKKGSANPRADSMPLPFGSSLSKASTLMEDAKHVQSLLDERNKTLEAIR